MTKVLGCSSIGKTITRDQARLSAAVRKRSPRSSHESRPVFQGIRYIRLYIYYQKKLTTSRDQYFSTHIFQKLNWTVSIILPMLRFSVTVASLTICPLNTSYVYIYIYIYIWLPFPCSIADAARPGKLLGLKTHSVKWLANLYRNIYRVFTV